MIQTKTNRRGASTVTASPLWALPNLTGRTYVQETHRHQHDADGGSAKLTLNSGTEWATSALQLHGMSRIKVSVDPRVTATPEKSIDPTPTKVIADGAKEQVAFFSSNSYLGSKADTVLHVQIAEVLRRAEALSHPAPTGHGVALIQRELRRYPENSETTGAPR